jgi:DNA-binding transcriptional MerR regulator
MFPQPLPGFRIGELSRRTGVSAQLLRTWEHRYGLLQPARSAGGYRLYTEADERRVRRMQACLAQGLSAAEAARAALRADATGSAFSSGYGLADGAAVLAASLDAFDETAVQAILDRLWADFTVESVLSQVILPYLHNLGERWANGQTSVACEHFASNILRGRLAGLARGWGDGHGPRAILACPPGEQHDLGLMMFGIVLHRNGWRVHYLGADTPAGELARTVRDVRPHLMVLAAVAAERYQPHVADLTRLAAAVSLGLAGAGATPALAAATGAQLMAGDPVAEAQQVQHQTGLRGLCPLCASFAIWPSGREPSSRTIVNAPLRLVQDVSQILRAVDALLAQPGEQVVARDVADVQFAFTQPPVLHQDPVIGELAMSAP